VSTPAPRTVEVSRPPRLLPLYLRAATSLLPGARRPPGVPGAGGELPARELALRDVGIDRARLAAYRQVTGFAETRWLPPTYPHVLAFPLHMALMTEPDFPFPAIGLVHMANEISQARPLLAAERLSLTVRASGPQAHARGRTFTILTCARADGELVWEERSTMLSRGRSREAPAAAPAAAPARAPAAATGPGRPAGPTGERGAPAGARGQEPPVLATGPGEPAGAVGGPAPEGERSVVAREHWTVAPDTGRRYGAASGDRNPIHMHALGARAFGFARPIAHGMWSKARCLAALAPELPEAFTVNVRFRKPLSLGAPASFECDRAGATLWFTLRSEDRETVHLEGRVEPAPDTAAEPAGGARAEHGAPRGREDGEAGR
jgi:acyl dehydratase